jgi:predicted  nucleic acid-binding Zn-ribbon protein
MSTPTIEITPETIQAAYKTLGIDQEVISKAEEEKEDSEKDKKEDTKKKKIQKSISELKDQLQKAETELAGLDGKKIEKSEDSTLNAINSLNDSIGKKFEAMATINKALSDQLGETREELKKSQEKIQALEETPIRKSVTTQNYIEKAFQEDEKTGNKMLSVSQHRTEIQNMLIEKAGLGGDDVIEKSIDTFWNNEMQYFEATGSLHPRALQKLVAEDKIQIVR